MLFLFSSPALANDDCNFFCTKAKDIQKYVTFYVGASGGYSRFQDAYESTGQSGLYRISLGSFLYLAKTITLGTELGFQSGAQMLLPEGSTKVLGENILPISLSIATPVDFLATIRVEPYKMFFFQAKGGAVHENISISGADVNTNYVWMPEFQAGFGITLNSRSRISINYQKFFGSKPILTNYNEDTGQSILKQAPIMQSTLLTIEINV